MKDLANLKKLKTLNLHDTGVSDAGLVHFKDFKSLEHINVRETQVTDAGLHHFKDCKNLKQLWLNNTKVTNAGIDELKKALPQCKIEWDGGVIEPASEADRKGAEYVLSIGGTVKVNGYKREVKAVADLPHEAFRLTSAALAHNQQANDAGLAHLKDCKNLNEINLYGTKVGDAGLEFFKDCKNLNVLNLSATHVTDAGLANFKDCKILQELWLGRRQIRR